MTDKVDIVRIEQSEDGSFGVLRINGNAWCVTLEPPESNNAENMSCIPAGRYTCRKVESSRFGTTFEIENVPDRTHILFHPGNVALDTKGCILLGRRFGTLRGDRGILDSGRAFREFMQKLEEVETFTFNITNGHKEAA